MTNQVCAQSYYFRHYQVENGLSNNAVICCLQDSKGFLWFGTKDGLNRFDGYTFKVFRNNREDSQSIGNNFIHSLYEDRNGNLWVGTDNGLYSYNANQENFSLLKGTENSPVREINMDGKGDLWFILNFNLFKYAKSKQLLTYEINKYFQATSTCVSAEGILWASTSDGLLEKYNSSNNSFSSFNVFSHSVSTTSKWIEKIYASPNGSILIGTGTQGAKIFDSKSATYNDIITYDNRKMELFVRNFIQAAKNEIWIATESGIFIHDLNSKKNIHLEKKYNDPYSLSDNAVYSFCKDREGGIWVCTYFGGVNYYPKQYTYFKKYFPVTNENSLSGNVVREIHPDKYGNLWIGTEDAGLNKFDTSTGVFTHYKPTGKAGSIGYTNIHGLLVNDDELWIGTFEHGLDIMNIKTGKVIKHYAAGPGDSSLKSNFIYCITKKKDGQILLGTTIGAYMYNRKSDNFPKITQFPLNNWYTSLLEDNNGIIWAATYGNGLRFYNTQTKKSGNFTYDPANINSIASNRINSIFIDKENGLWLGTEGGLCKFNNQTNNFTTFSKGFPGNFILSILEDDKKNLWISTSGGLICFNRSTQNVTTYTTINGILNDQFNFNSAFKDASGKMYFGSVKGLISFRPEDEMKNEFIPPVFITSFKVFNKEISIDGKDSPLKKSITYSDKITLNYEQSTLSIGFAALNYTAPEMAEYAYKMEGLDKNWTYLKRDRTAYFTNLSPGTYIFDVKASISSGVWDGQQTKLIIKILPPWWASNWAFVLYFILGSILILGIVLYYHKRAQAKNQRKFEILSIAKEKEMFNAKIEFFTNVAHEIRTPLTLIRAPLEKVLKKSDNNKDIQNNLEIMERNTNRLIDLTNQLLDFRQTEIKGFSLNFVKANISELVEDTYKGFKLLADQKNLIFNLSLPKNTVHASVDLDAFNKILNNLFSNTIKYAVKEAKVELRVANETGKNFILDFKNDGFLIPVEMSDKIFEPFFRIKETKSQKGTGIGLALSNSLVQLHKGILELKNPDNNFNYFSLTMPVLQENYNTLPLK
ncbi:MAG: two-component regulator propeller domain-containing protein [Ginsengibacter sp.]